MMKVLIGFGIIIAVVFALSWLSDSNYSQIVGNNTVENMQTEASESVAENSAIFSRSSLPNHGLAPELENSIWLNTSEPLILADLRDKVVLIEMWTYG